MRVLGSILILIGLLMLGWSMYENVQLAWIQHPDYTSRQLWIKHTAEMALITALCGGGMLSAFGGYLLWVVGVAKMKVRK